jgi:hypothetical protein
VGGRSYWQAFRDPSGQRAFVEKRHAPMNTRKRDDGPAAVGAHQLAVLPTPNTASRPLASSARPCRDAALSRRRPDGRLLST